MKLFSKKTVLSKLHFPLLLSLALAVLVAPEVPAQNSDPVVLMQTTKGTMQIRVYASMAPRTARNFLDLVSRGFYDGKSFHRVETWCIQGGDPNGNGSGSFVDPDSGQVRYVPLEINRNLNHGSAGVVAMARSANPNSASCQFYILKKPVPQLNGQYAVFGGVIGGLNTIYGISPGDRIIHAEIISGGSGQESQGQSRPQNQGQTSEGQGQGQSGGGQTQGGGGQSGF